MSESIEMCKIVHLHSFQRPILRMQPAPEVHNFAIRCMNFLSHFEHSICHKSMVQTYWPSKCFLGDVHRMCASNNSLNLDTGFMHDCYLTTNSK